MSGGSLALAGGLKKHLGGGRHIHWGMIDNSTHMTGFNFMRNVGAGRSMLHGFVGKLIG